MSPVYTTDKPLYDRLTDESLPFYQFLKKQFTARVARDFYNFLGEMFDAAIDDKSVLSEMAYVRFEELTAVPGQSTYQVDVQLLNLKDEAVEGEQTFELAAFDDAELTIPASSAVLQNASVGSIVYGEGTAGIKVKTDANGHFVCDVYDASDETVYVGAMQVHGSPVISCRGSLLVLFN